MPTPWWIRFLGRFALAMLLGSMLATIGIAHFHPRTPLPFELCAMVQLAGAGLLMTTFGLWVDHKRYGQRSPKGAFPALRSESARAPRARRAPFRKPFKSS